QRFASSVDCCQFGKRGGIAMDTIQTYRNDIKKTLLRYAKLRPSDGDIRVDPVFDETRDHYTLMYVGWNRGERVRGEVAYVRIADGKVYIEWDGIGYGITDELIAGGIPENKIVHAFLPEEASVT
ncbi:MAG: XisI protein, partial [Candidatus Poribacteria bacterium]